MFALKTTHRAAAVFRGRSVYHFKPFNTSRPKYGDARYSHLMTGNAREAIELKQGLKEDGLAIDHLTKIDQGFKDLGDELREIKDMARDGFKRTDPWFLFFASAFLLKEIIDTAISADMFKKRSKEN